jgi:predicted translin family RNA/ssDNA-binding protein
MNSMFLQNLFKIFMDLEYYHLLVKNLRLKLLLNRKQYELPLPDIKDKADELAIIRDLIEEYQDIKLKIDRIRHDKMILSTK